MKLTIGITEHGDGVTCVHVFWLDCKKSTVSQQPALRQLEAPGVTAQMMAIMTKCSQQ